MISINSCKPVVYLSPAKSAQYGVGLIEVMVSLIVLALGVLGFAALQVRSLNATSKSIAYTESISFIKDLKERIRSNPDGIADYVTASNAAISKPSQSCGAFKDAGTVIPCNPAELAAADVYAIKSQMAALDLDLGMITCPGTTGNGIMEIQCIIISWNETSPDAGTDGDDSDGALNCIDNATGRYFPKSDCIMMEATS